MLPPLSLSLTPFATCLARLRWLTCACGSLALSCDGPTARSPWSYHGGIDTQAALTAACYCCAYLVLMCWRILQGCETRHACPAACKLCHVSRLHEGQRRCAQRPLSRSLLRTCPLPLAESVVIGADDARWCSTGQFDWAMHISVVQPPRRHPCLHSPTHARVHGVLGCYLRSHVAGRCVFNEHLRIQLRLSIQACTLSCISHSQRTKSSLGTHIAGHSGVPFPCLHLRR